MASPVKKTQKPKLKFFPATKERWKDLVSLFGEKGACSGCWCMWWLKTGKEFSLSRGQKNKLFLKKRIDSGIIPGILAYDKNEPVGWCAVEPRESYPRLEKSRSLKPIDDKPVWSLVCFFVDKDYRRQGVSIELVKAAVNYARKKGAKIVEGYPSETKNNRLPDPWVWTGLFSAFIRAGFKEVMRRSKSRPVMRCYIK
jgi:GNAT superfamily N-acetyltransferase